MQNPPRRRPEAETKNTRSLERIGQVIDLWGEAGPGEDLAASIYALSLNPQHRLAARGYFKDRAAEYASRQFNP